MEVRKVSELERTERDVRGVGFRSIRIALDRDGLGFSVHKTLIPKGGPHHWHYKHHMEACYCIAGTGVLTCVETGERHKITSDTCYLLNQHDDHTFQALTDVILISVFNPPITGQEVHQSDGSYERVKELFS